MEKREGELKSAFTQEMKLRLPGFYMLQHASRAAPDRSITGNGRTTMWEFKHGTPDFESHGDQELMCRRLSVAGYCRYVIWQESLRGNDQITMIVHPKTVFERKGWNLTPEAWCVGFDHRWLVNFVKKIHEEK